MTDDDPTDRIGAWRRDAERYHYTGPTPIRELQRDLDRLERAERLQTERRLLLGVACLVLCVVLTTAFPILLYPALVTGIVATIVGIVGLVVGIVTVGGADRPR